MIQTKKAFITSLKLIINVLGILRLDQITSVLLTMNKHRLQSLLLWFVLHMPNITLLNLNYTIIDTAQDLNIVSECAM